MDSSSISETLSLVQRVIGLGKKATNIQYEEALLAAREALVIQGQENLKLKEENLGFKEELKKKDDFILEKSVMWLKKDTEKNQPFCPVCLVNGKEIPLSRTWARRKKEETLWHCPNKECNQSFNPWDYEEPDGGGIVVGGSMFNYPEQY